MSLELCPVCAEGYLHPKIYTREVESRGFKGMLDMHYSLCDDCGSEVAGADEMQKNKQLMHEFWRRCDDEADK